MNNIKSRNFIKYFSNFPHILENIFENIDDGTTVESLYLIKNKRVHTACNKSHHLRKMKSQLDEIFDNIKKDGSLLKNVAKEFQTEKICMAAIQQNKWAFDYVANQTCKLCEMAVNKNPHSLNRVKNKTFWLCCEAVHKDETCLYYVPNSIRNEVLSMTVVYDNIILVVAISLISTLILIIAGTH